MNRGGTALILPFASGSLIAQRNHRSLEGTILLRGNCGHIIAGTYDSFLNHPRENSLSRHDAFSHPFVDGAVAVALLSDLGHFQLSCAGAEPGSNRQRGKIDAFYYQVFPEGSV